MAKFSVIDLNGAAGPLSCDFSSFTPVRPSGRPAQSSQCSPPPHRPFPVRPRVQDDHRRGDQEHKQSEHQFHPRVSLSLCQAAHPTSHTKQDARRIEHTTAANPTIRQHVHGCFSCQTNCQSTGCRSWPDPYTRHRPCCSSLAHGHRLRWSRPSLRPRRWIVPRG